MRDPQYSTEPNVQRELRHIRARKEAMWVDAIGKGPIGRLFSVRSASERRYEVEVRDSAHRVNTCTCADFRVNGLGTCKHVEAVLAKHGRGGAGLAREAGRSFVYLDRLRGGTVALHPPDARGGAAVLRGAFFGADGTFRGRSEADLARMLELAGRLPGRGVAIGPEVSAELALRRDEAAWAHRAAALTHQAEAGRDPFPFLSKPLYPYQVKGALHLLERRRAILGDEMGLGKTVQAIAAAVFLLREREAKRVLVVCPASLKHQWTLEVRRFAGLEPTVVEGFPAARKKRYDSESPFIVANYEQIFRDRRYLQSSTARGFDVVILDEAQRIKNWRAKTSNAVKDLRDRCRFAFVLTGTPLENNLEELYSVCQFVRPELLGPLWRFHDRYYRLDEDGHTRGYRNLDELRARLSGIYVRRTKESVQLELPDRVVNRFYVALTPEQREAHDDYAQGVAMLIAMMKRRPLTEEERKRLSILLLMMRRACDDSTMAKGRAGPTPKLDELERILDDVVEAGGRKAIIFSEWTDMLDRVAERLRRRRLGHVYLHGGVPTPRRGEICERFRNDPTCRVFLSTEAGGLGLNLQAASVVIHMDLPWNPAKLEQRNGRAHRIGQRHTVQVITLVAKDSVESRFESLIESKRALFDAVFRPGATETEVDLPSLGGPMLTLLSEIVEGLDASGRRTEPADATGSRSALAPMPRPTLEEGLSRTLRSEHRVIRRPARAGGSRPDVVVAGPDVTGEVTAVVAAAGAASEGPPPVVVSADVGDLLEACLGGPGPANGGVGSGAAHDGAGGANGNGANRNGAHGNGAHGVDGGNGAAHPAAASATPPRVGTAEGHAAAAPRFEPPDAPPSRAERALKAAFHLRAGGFGAEAVVQASRAILGALADLLARHGLPVPPDPQVAAAVRRHLVPSGRVPRALLDRSLSSLAWAQGFDLEDQLPSSLAEELLEEVRGVVGAIRQA